MLNSLDPNKRLLVYLVINVVVSALTTLLVLTIWSRFALAAPEFEGGLAATEGSQAAGQVSINSVIAVGDLANERVVIEHISDQDLSLAGWRLRDENGNEYRFPALVLHADARVNVFSGQGADSSTDLYWGRSVAVWASGEQAELLDASGQPQAVYSVP
ncbi:MAG TPA: lamin tail domain-containing protein [Anaerolineales bacterium]